MRRSTVVLILQCWSASRSGCCRRRRSHWVRPVRTLAVVSILAVLVGLALSYVDIEWGTPLLQQHIRRMLFFPE